MFNLLSLFRKNIKFYGHFISLGYNCECAYRFFQKHKFVESSLFTWTNSERIENIIKAINDLNLIFSEEPVVDGVMWLDRSTNICFHGTEPFEMHQNPDKYTEEDYKPYKEELVSRINHLKQKFDNQIKDEKKTLLMYTYRTYAENKKQIVDKILELEDSLKNAGSCNYDLLIILEEKDNISEFLHKFGKNIYIRYVKEFAPEEDVTTKIYDKKSWKVIMDEFRPNFRQKKTKKFKFEQM